MGEATFEASGEGVVMILRARTNGVASSRSGRNCVTTQLRAPRELRGDAEKMKASCPSTTTGRRVAKVVTTICACGCLSAGDLAPTTTGHAEGILHLVAMRPASEKGLRGVKLRSRKIL
jgi:hypothetical protein